MTAALPPAVCAADVVGPSGPIEGRPTPAPTPVIGALPIVSEGLLNTSLDPNLTLAVAPALSPTAVLPQSSSRPTALTAGPTTAASPLSVASPLAQATAALPSAEQQKSGAVTGREAGEKVFSGARAASGNGNDLPAGGDAGAVEAGSSEAASGPSLDRPTGRGPPSRREPPSNKPGGNGGPRRWAKLAGLAVLAAILGLSPARAGAIDTLASQAHVVAVDFAKHGPLLGIISGISALGYDFSNVVGFLYPLTQVHALFKARSGKVSLASQFAGMGASLLLAFNMFFLNKPGASTLFSAYQNLFGGLSFGVIIAQALFYNRHPGKEGEAPSKGKVAAQTLGVIGALIGATAVLGAAVTGWLPTIHAAPLIIPFQMILGFGFAYLTLPGYLKIEREKSVGAASFGTTAMFFVANASLVVWAIYRLATLPGVAAMGALAGATAFSVLATVGSLLAFRWLASRSWSFIPETLKVLGREVRKSAVIDIVAFVAVSVFMTALVAAGYGALNGLIHIPAAQQRDALTFMFYLVDVILASTSALLTMRAFRKYKRD